MELPTTIKCILQCPEDEQSWKKLESLRRAICAVVEGGCEVFFRDAAEIEAVALAIEACTSATLADEVGKTREGKTCKLHQGTRVQVRIPRPEKEVPRLRERIVASVRSLKDNDSIRVKLRPLKTCRAPPLDGFGQRMLGADMRKLAESKKRR